MAEIATSIAIILNMCFIWERSDFLSEENGIRILWIRFTNIQIVAQPSLTHIAGMVVWV
jgi:hypothetical protein